jgi:hypothetical protein
MRRIINASIWAGLILFLGFSALHAQYQVPYGVVASGGGVQSGSNIVYCTAGQTGISGALTGGSYQVKSGFWHIAGTSTSLEVAITSFMCEYEDDAVVIDWSVSASAPFIGFNIYRSGQEEGIFDRLNEEIIPATGEGSYRDETVFPGKEYYYKLGAVEEDGITFSGIIKVTLPPKPLTLEQNYPNPFNPATFISFFAPEPGPASLVIYNVQGKRVRTLLDGNVEAGRQTVSWNGTNDRGDVVGSGVYYCRLRKNKKILTQKLVLLR